MEQAAELRSKIEEQVQSVELEIADLGERAKTAPDAGEFRKQESNARARLAEMRKQIQDLDRQDAEREKLLATRQAHRDQLDAERKAEQTALAAMEARLRDARGETGFRGERLKMIDPGIVPGAAVFAQPAAECGGRAACGPGAADPVLHAGNEFSAADGAAAVRAAAAFRAVAKARG